MLFKVVIAAKASDICAGHKKMFTRDARGVVSVYFCRCFELEDVDISESHTYGLLAKRNRGKTYQKISYVIYTAFGPNIRVSRH